MCQLPFHVESLEQRRLLAGVVNVTTNSAEDISITGDNRANEIALVKEPQAIYLRGLNGTQIRFNGQTMSELEIDALKIPADMRVRLRGGNDVFHISSGMWFDRDLEIDLGGGNDSLELPQSQTGGVNIKQDLRIRSGSGFDVVKIERLEIDGDVEVDLRGSVNGVFIDRLDAWRDVEINGRSGVEWINIEDTKVRGSLDVNTRGGRDPVFLRDSDVSGDLTVNLGAGRGASYAGSVDAVVIRSEDSVAIEGDVTISAGSGEHFVYLIAEEDRALTIAGNLDIATRSGDDRIDLDFRYDSTVEMAGAINIDSGGGDDAIHFDIDSGLSAFNAPITVLTRGGDDFIDLDELRTSDSLRLDMGGGDDFLGLLSTRTGLLSVDLGGGNDRLSGVDALFAGNTVIDGGAGSDENQLASWSRILPATVEFVSF